MLQTNSNTAKAVAELLPSSQFFVKQIKENLEIFTDWETKNNYDIHLADGQRLGYVSEQGGGFGGTIVRLILRSHRGLNIDVRNAAGMPVLHFFRRWFFIFSDLYVLTPQKKFFGSVHRRWGWFIYKKYDLLDETKRVFARIEAPIWRLWTFPIYLNHPNQKVGYITKKWQGILKETFTDADQFLVEMGESKWTESQKAVLLAAAVSIDFDFFENNQGKEGGLLGG